MVVVTVVVLLLVLLMVMVMLLRRDLWIAVCKLINRSIMRPPRH